MEQTLKVQRRQLNISILRSWEHEKIDTKPLVFSYIKKTVTGIYIFAREVINIVWLLKVLDKNLRKKINVI